MLAVMPVKSGLRSYGGLRNFGHNRDYGYYDKYPYLAYKTISFWKHIKDGYRYFRIFPLDSLKVMTRKMVVGFSVVISGKRSE